MFHHSFEHIADPLKTIKSVARLLSPKGICILRLPIVSSYAWNYYGTHWIQLDAPRHFFLHSIESIRILLKKVNLVVDKIVYDSTDFQFWGSEQHIKGIPFISSQSHTVNPKNSIFSKKDIKRYKQKAKELNLKDQGDQAVFYLKKIGKLRLG